MKYFDFNPAGIESVQIKFMCMGCNSVVEVKRLLFQKTIIAGHIKSQIVSLMMNL